MLAVATAYDALRSHLSRKPNTPSPARWRPYHSRKVTGSNPPDSTPHSSEREAALPTPEYTLAEAHHRSKEHTRRPARPQPAPVAPVQDPEGLIEDSLNLLASTYNPSMAARAQRSAPALTSASALPTPPASPTPKTSVPSIAPHVMHWFIVELLRRSHTSAPVIRAALEYISRAAPEIQRAIEQSDASAAGDSPLADPRRVYLAAIILSSKFLLDRTYTNKTWAGVSGLDALEVGRCERALAEALEWRLWIGGPAN